MAKSLYILEYLENNFKITSESTYKALDDLMNYINKSNKINMTSITELLNNSFEEVKTNQGFYRLKQNDSMELFCEKLKELTKPYKDCVIKDYFVNIDGVMKEPTIENFIETFKTTCVNQTPVEQQTSVYNNIRDHIIRTIMNLYATGDLQIKIFKFIKSMIKTEFKSTKISVAELQSSLSFIINMYCDTIIVEGNPNQSKKWSDFFENQIIMEKILQAKKRYEEESNDIDIIKDFGVPKLEYQRPYTSIENPEEAKKSIFLERSGFTLEAKTTSDSFLRFSLRSRSSSKGSSSMKNSFS